jgi:hypothetical protein
MSQDWFGIVKETQHHGELTVPSRDWKLLASLLIHIGDIERANLSLRGVYDDGAPTLIYEDRVNPSTVRVSCLPHSFTVGISPYSSNREYWFVGTRIVELLPIVKYWNDNSRRYGTVDISMADNSTNQVLSFCCAEPRHNLIPDVVFVDNAGYATERLLFEQELVPWVDRDSKLFWRGTTTGIKRGSWKTLPRIRLCELARSSQVSEYFDCGISSIVQCTAEESSAIEASGLMSNYVPVNKFNRFRYHIDIDGNSNSWPGLFLKLLSGGLVFKIASAEGFQQWYYGQLIPWFNFVPVQSDMSDLLDVAKWIFAHQDRAQRIALAGQRLALGMTLISEAERSLPIFEAKLV